MKLRVLFLLWVSLLTAQDQELSRYWAQGDFLLWGIQNQPLPVPLVTSGTYADPIPGAIGESGTHVLLGNSPVNMGWMEGFQLSFGLRLDESKRYGCEASYFLLPEVKKKKSISTSGEPGDLVLAVPIFDVTGVSGLNGIPGETIYILPGPLFGTTPGFQGDLQLRLWSKLQGAELNGLFRVFREYIDAMLGLRFFELNESLHFDVNTASVPGVPFPFAFTNTHDRFNTKNDFFSGQVGMRTRYTWQKWSLAASMKVALGGMREHLRIKGFTQTSNGTAFFMTQGTAGEVISGGIFAQPTNIGSHSRWQFAALLDANVNGAVSLGKYIEALIGYSFLWITEVIRPGNQIDRNINTTLTGLADASRSTVGTGSGPIPFGIPGKAPPPSGSDAPSALFKSRSFWAQGLSFGLKTKF